MLPKKLRHNPGRIRAIVYAVLVNAVAIGLAVVGFRWTMTPGGDEQVVQAVAIPSEPLRKPEEVDKRVQQEAEARKKAEAEKRHQDELKKKQAEELRKKQEEEKVKERELAERKKKEAEELARQKKEAEEQEIKIRAAELERKNEEKRRQKLTEQALQEQLAAEEKARQQATFAARSASEVDKYKVLIRQRVSRSWNRPGGIAKGLKCVVHVRLTPKGEVLSAAVVRSSGNPIFDRSVEYAVYKAAPLPLPEDPALFDNFRDIEFLFNPE
ncbi:MAG: cell envelope integrity protein TolA [Sulfuricaulis sp.]|uniref:cell envelope integrity protein TolA n=1 Tax=Sulfuricaulis sp. TaxID=2003553 RepID=UPI0034A1C5A0